MAEEKSNKKSIEDYGIIFVSGSIDGGSAERICQEIIKINLERPSDHIQMIINSGGGAISAGFAIIDMMEWSSLPVYTTGLGLVASMALGIFMSGDKGHRILTPRTSMLSHRFFGINMGNHSELIAHRKEEDFLHERLIEHYIAHSNIQTRQEVESLLLRDVDTWLTPDEAILHGIADSVYSAK
jgi:ATP-dependent Clp protease protease subunit